MTQCMIIAGDAQKQSRLEKMFQAYGFDLKAPANANDALDQCQHDMPDVIVLPENLKDMDAIAFMKRLRRAQAQKGTGPAVFLCTDVPDSGKIGRAIWEGAADVLIEPFDEEVLDRKLKQVGLV